MSGWSRTTKPSADKTINPDHVFGVDRDETAGTPGVSGPGWVRRKAFGSRVQQEVLVAMKNPPTDDGSDDAYYTPSFVVTFTTHPATQTVAAEDPVSFEVAYTLAPTGYSPDVDIQWQVSEDEGDTWENITDEDGLELDIADSTGLDGFWYRAEISGELLAQTYYSNTAILTVTA